MSALCVSAMRQGVTGTKRKLTDGVNRYPTSSTICPRLLMAVASHPFRLGFYLTQSIRFW